MTTAPPPPGRRLVSLDVFRGATIAAMILVNNSGDAQNTFWPLRHQPWHGWTPTDVIFPFFLFMAGMTLTFSQRLGFQSALVRSLKLISLGLLVNFTTGGFVLSGLRWAGVLQRIGVCVLAAWAAKRWLGPRGQALLAAVLLLGYFGLMTQVRGPEGHPPSLETETNLAAQVDRLVLEGHLYRWTKTWDPEGVLSTLPAIATALLGLLTGEWLQSLREPKRKAAGLIAVGLVVVALAIAWGDAAPLWLRFPINKMIWTSSFVLLTGGLAAALFGLTFWVVDVRGRRGWTVPFVTYGKNAIAVYVGSEVLSGALDSIRWPSATGAVLSLQERLYAAAFAPALPPSFAALAWALAHVLVWYAVARWMEHRSIYLKV
ncbi:MAG TPA: heparan-alpha-glucosaminide N-acetyltransferase domain-containing protein [Vicinamibacteria bacterium]|nr:heparan-alpha-glucosaminide N-acetyltransferase domain-containing protein [Vicinamibacteria bacterium]